MSALLLYILYHYNRYCTSAGSSRFGEILYPSSPVPIEVFTGYNTGYIQVPASEAVPYLMPSLTFMTEEISKLDPLPSGSGIET